MVLGSVGVGKSALTIRFITGNYYADYDPTIEDSYRKSVKIYDRPVLLDILDTAGDEAFSAMRDQWMHEANNFMIVYDIQSLESFEEAKSIYQKLPRWNDYMNVVLVASKCDLYDQDFGAQSRMKLTSKNVHDLVYGYMRIGQRLCRNYTMNIPKEIKAICLSYHGEPIHIEVTKEMGQNLAKSWEDNEYKVGFIETSAKTDHNVYLAFEQLVCLPSRLN